jgi:hypothetical protein
MLLGFASTVAGCKAESKFDFLDASSNSGVCEFTSESPSITTNSTVRASASPTGVTVFSVTPGGTDCKIEYFLNGALIPDENNTILNLSSASLQAGENTLEAKVTGSAASDTRTWTIRKNNPPTCTTQTPAATGQSLGVGANVALTANAADPDLDPLTWTWTVNSATPASGVLSTISNSSQSQGIFAPNSQLVGANTVTGSMSDGYDTAACSWSITVSSTCVITGAVPSTATVRVPNTPTASNNFLVSTGGGGCTIAWALNGAPLAGATNSQSILSSSLNSSNVLTATATNGGSTTTQSWTVVKNSPPTCAQSPAATGSTVPVGGNISFAATSTDSNTDPLTFTWTVDGSVVSNTILNPTTLGNVSTGVFAPSSIYSGTRNVKATISDSYDSTECGWTTSVSPVCSIVSSLPSTATVRVANGGSTSSTYAIVPNDSSCAISWALNGSPLVGETTSFLTSLSSSLNAGNNTLVASVTNGSSTATRTWTVVKNSVPTCGSQVPASTGNTMSRLSTLSFTANGSDGNSDALTFAWKLDNSLQPTLFSVSGASPSSTAIFSPGLGQVGTGRIVTSEIYDGYDTGSCQWTLTVQDPDTVQISSCTPSANPVVVASTGGAATQILNVAATGTSLTYLWKQDGVTIGGATSPALTLTAGGLAVGNYVLVAEVRDAYSNMQSCTFNVKRNAPPVLTMANPSNASAVRLNYASSIPLSISGSDANGDTISYTWRLNSSASTTLPSGFASTTFNPNSTIGLVGAHTISVTASDGVETATVSWPAEVNLFTDACNSLYNGTGGASGTSSGKICTLVGQQTVGDGRVPASDQSLIRVQPYELSKDQAGVIYFTDTLSHVTWVWNRTSNAITRFGNAVGVGEIKAVMGNGAGGASTDGLTGREYKLNSPLGVAIDQGTAQIGADTYSQATVYVADYNNHRVVQMGPDGIANRIFGTGTAGNTANTDGAAGTAHHCQNPSGLKVMNINGIKSLVISCYSNHVIKYMGLDSADTATYLKGFTLVGRLTAGATNAGSFDGIPGAGGDASVNGPWSLANDSAGNLFWTDINTGRLRMLNLQGSTQNFFTAGNGKSTSTTINIGAAEVTSGWSGNTNIVANATSGAADRFAVTAPTLMRTGVCYPIRVRRRNSSNTSVSIASTQAVNLSIAAGTAAIHSNVDCSSVATSVTIPANSSVATFYVTAAAPTTIIIRASQTGFSNGDSAAITVAALSGSAANALNFVAPTEFVYDECIPVLLQFRNGAAVAAVSGARTVRLYTNGTGTFYDGAACAGTPTNRVSVANGTAEYFVSYSRNTSVASGNVTSLAGNGSAGGVSYGGANVTNSIQGVGGLQMRSPRGLTVVETSGSLRGFLIGQLDNHRILFINASAATVAYGGVSIEPGDVNTVIGTGSGGYSSEDIGGLAQVNVPYGMLQIDDSTIYFADNANGRLRSFNLAIPNGSTAGLLGQGVLRSGFSGDGGAASSAQFNAPHWIAIDNTNRHLLFADNQNRRIRQVDLLTGIISSPVGKGFGNPTTENEDPTNVFMQGPRGLRFVDTGTNKFYIYSDTNGGTGTNRACMLRAWNRFGPTATLFGVSFAPNRVNTILGDYNLGCGTWGATPDNTAALSARLFLPDGFAIDSSGNMYVANYDDHCIIKMSAGGLASKFTGTCGSVTGWPGGGLASTAVLRYPTAITMDANYSADGNFFFVDGVDMASGRIRYVNFRTSSLTLGGVSVPAGSAANPSITTIVFLSNAGQGRLYGLAQFGSQLCYSSGDPGNPDNGAHNVTCRDLATALGSTTLRVGPDEGTSTVRGGGPLGVEQEGAASTSARMYAPLGLAFDGDGNLYISDRSNHLVRMVRRWFN